MRLMERKLHRGSITVSSVLSTEQFHYLPDERYGLEILMSDELRQHLQICSLTCPKIRAIEMFYQVYER